jgi:hypothetical protein
MKRFFLMLVAVFAAAALVAGTGAASDTKGPPCTNVIAGDTGYFGGTVTVILTLEAPACSDGSYLLDIYNLAGDTLLVGDLTPTNVSGDTVTFSYSFSGTPPDGVCLVARTFYKKHLADRAPDSGCHPQPTDSSGGSTMN